MADGRAAVLRIDPGNAASHRVARAVGAVERGPDAADDGLVRDDLDPAEVTGLHDHAGVGVVGGGS